jgi:hypothetical protein
MHEVLHLAYRYSNEPDDDYVNDRDDHGHDDHDHDENGHDVNDHDDHDHDVNVFSSTCHDHVYSCHHVYVTSQLLFSHFFVLYGHVYNLDHVYAILTLLNCF